MVQQKHWKSYTALVLPDFVEIGIEQYHPLYKNWKYWGLGQQIYMAVMKGLNGHSNPCSIHESKKIPIYLT